MTQHMLLRLLPATVLCAAALSACGGSSGSSEGGAQAHADTATTTVPAEPAPTPPPPPPSGRDPRELPAGVPLRASRPADPEGARVVRAWSAAMRAGDLAAANALWTAPAKVQNGTPVLTLATPAEIALFNSALPCGSVVTAAGGAPRGFVVATVRLTQRKGADCGSGAGNSARTAIRVSGGKIVEWYRLPDDPDAPGLLRPPDNVDSTTV
jgi:limonene-1,2-epoxide hydrolase